MKTTQKNKKLLTLYVKKLVKENYFNDDVLTDFLYHYNSQKLAELNTIEEMQNYLITVLLNDADVKADKMRITIKNKYFLANKTTGVRFLIIVIVNL